MDKSALEMTAKSLQEARTYAIAAGLDYHFISDIDHLVSTAKNNIEEAK